jgi:dynein heavy chain 2
MNPASKGYGGRSKLPDNLKILFRPVAMSVPDNLQIAQTLLYAEGFKNGEILSKKVTTLFTLCKQGLSYQQHYDWGLRALKTILTVASQQIQNYLNEGKVASYEEETSILIKAIRIIIIL